MEFFQIRKLGDVTIIIGLLKKKEKYMRLPFINVKNIIPFCFFIVMTFFAPRISQGQELTFAVTHWPPYSICEQDTPCSGIDVEIVKEIAKRLNTQLKIEKCPWKRCLYIMEKGEADIISSLLRVPDREVYMRFIEPPYRPGVSKVFYLKKGSRHLIQKYEDLHKLKIGTILGSKYFSRFDNDSKIRKIEVAKEYQLLELLKAGRIDAFINDEQQADYLIFTKGYQGQFDKASFRSEKGVAYLAISKKSKFANQLSIFNNIIAQMKSEGKVKEILNMYFKK
jgi:polar amino acid transport system substrate-binding protein